MRYYYTDPLAAAWMMFRHNIKFEHGITSAYTEAAHDFTTHIKIFTLCKPDEQQKFYVHPDSVHLLEPQKNDLVYASYCHKTNYVYRLVTNVFKDSFEVGGFSKYGYKQPIEGREIHKIIQRNGIAFMTPEAEQ